jgi:hypothetical protein
MKEEETYGKKIRNKCPTIEAKRGNTAKKSKYK